MKHYSLAALALGLTLASAACSGNSRNPIYYPGSGPRTTVSDRDRNGDGRDDRTGEVINREKNKSNRDGVRCNAGNGNGNGNGRCRNGNRGNGNGRRGNE